MKRVKYDSYKFTAKELLIHISIGIAVDAIIAYLFYRSYVAFVVFLPAILFYLKIKKEDLLSKQKKELALQFREAIMAVSASLTVILKWITV